VSVHSGSVGQSSALPRPGSFDHRDRTIRTRRPVRDEPVHRGDRGVATVYACLGVLLLLVVTGLAVRLGAAGLARQRAETGADLAALAGAAKVLQGPDMVCAAVVRVAIANGGSVESCSVVGTDVLVMVTVRVGTGVLAGTATAKARAGPIEMVSEVAG